MNFLKTKQAAVVTGGMFGGAVAGILLSTKDISMLWFFIMILFGIFLGQLFAHRVAATNPFLFVKIFSVATLISALVFIPVARSLLLHKYMSFDFDLILFLPTLVMVGVSLLLSLLLSSIAISRFIK